MTEPKRETNIQTLVWYVRDRVAEVMKQMILRGYDPVIFETRRSKERQEWLYGVGRTHSKDRDPVTWTKDSRHIPGKAVDVISHAHGWSNKEFFRALGEEAQKQGLHQLAEIGDMAHLEWRG